jgi:hypothetical protein
MTTIKTIDTQIRERAAKELWDELQALARPLAHRISAFSRCGLFKQKAGGEFELLFDETTLDMTVNKIYQDEKPRKEQEAVDAFIAEVRKLKDDIVRLQNYAEGRAE